MPIILSVFDYVQSDDKNKTTRTPKVSSQINLNKLRLKLCQAQVKLSLRLRLRIGLRLGLGLGLRMGLGLGSRCSSVFLLFRSGGWEEKWRLKLTSA